MIISAKSFFPPFCSLAIIKKKKKKKKNCGYNHFFILLFHGVGENKSFIRESLYRRPFSYLVVRGCHAIGHFQQRAGAPDAAVRCSAEAHHATVRPQQTGQGRVAVQAGLKVCQCGSVQTLKKIRITNSILYLACLLQKWHSSKISLFWVNKFHFIPHLFTTKSDIAQKFHCFELTNSILYLACLLQEWQSSKISLFWVNKFHFIPRLFTTRVT